MVDKIKPLKIETDEHGTQIDFTPTEAKPSEDHIACKGVAFENSDDTLVRGDSGVMKFKDSEVTPEVSLSDLYGDGGVSRYSITCGYSGNAATGTYLQFFRNNPSNDSPYVVPEDATIKAVSVSFKTNSTLCFDTYVNGVFKYSLQVTADNRGFESCLNIPVVAGDEISVITSGPSNARDVVFVLKIQTSL